MAGAVAQSGCGLLLGNVKSSEEKSESYGVMDLSATHPDWQRLDPAAVGETKKGSPEENSSGISDVVYQSKKTAATISLNSSCRPAGSSESDESLQKLTELLFLGIGDVSFREEKTLTVQNQPALQTTIRGKLETEEVMLRTLVLKKSGCVYDLLYLAPPNHFYENEMDFGRFVNSLRLK
jgi:hypothetical protein